MSGRFVVLVAERSRTAHEHAAVIADVVIAHEHAAVIADGVIAHGSMQQSSLMLSLLTNIYEHAAVITDVVITHERLMSTLMNRLRAQSSLILSSLILSLLSDQ